MILYTENSHGTALTEKTFWKSEEKSLEVTKSSKAFIDKQGRVNVK